MRAEGRAGFFLRDAPAVLAAGRAKGPSPTAAAVMVARALYPHLKRRRLYAGRAFGRPRDPKKRAGIESASETAPAYAGLRFIHAREAFAASACRVLFCQSGLAANAGAARSYGVDGDCWPPPRRADGCPTCFRMLPFDEFGVF